MRRQDEYRDEQWLRSKFKDILDLGHESEASPLVQWSHAARKQAPVLFVGAGFSLNAQPRTKGVVMRDWNALASSLATALPVHSTERDALWTAERYKGAFGPQRLYEKILDAVPDREVEPGTAHHALTGIEWHTVLTFNYDTLLERTFERDGSRRVVSVISERQLARATAPDTLSIVHLHGHIEHPETITLTLDDFRRYPNERPLFITVVRQLLAQHPTLFLGFGATDPNFIAWSGWIYDCIGASSPSWLRLDYYPQEKSRPPADAGFEAFWSPRLQTVQYAGSQFAALMDTLASAIRPLGKEEYSEHALTLRGWEDDRRTRETLRTIDYLVQSDPQRSEERASEDRKRAIHSALSQMLYARIEAKDQVDKWLGPTNETMRRGSVSHSFSSSVVPGELTSALPSLESQRSEIRAALGDSLLVEWLVVAVREMGIHPAVSSQEGSAFFDAVDEYRRLRRGRVKEQETEAKIMELGLLMSGVLIEDRAEDETASQTLSRALGVSSVDDVPTELRDLFQDAVLRSDIASGYLPQGGVADDERGATAQTSRRRAYIAAGRGDHGAAWQLYKEAAQRSQQSMEPDWLELETIRQALRAHRKESLSSQERDEEGFEKLVRRERFLADPPRPGVVQGLAAERKTLRYHFDQLSELRRLIAIGRVPVNLVWRSEPLGRHLQRMEDCWLYYKCREIALRLVAVHEYQGQWAEMCRLWRRYGTTKETVDAVWAHVAAPRGALLEGDLVRFLERWCLRESATKFDLCSASAASSELPVSTVCSIASRLVPHALDEGRRHRGTEATEALMRALGRLPWSEAEKLVFPFLDDLSAQSHSAFYYTNALWQLLDRDVWARWWMDGADSGFQKVTELCGEIAMKAVRNPDFDVTVDGFAFAVLKALDSRVFGGGWSRWGLVDPLGLRPLVERLSDHVKHAELRVLLRRHLGETPESLHRSINNTDDDEGEFVAWFQTAPADVTLVDLEGVRAIESHCERVLGDVNKETPKFIQRRFQTAAYLMVEALCIQALRGEATPEFDLQVRRALSLAPWALPAVIETRPGCADLPTIRGMIFDFLAPRSCEDDAEARQVAGLAACWRLRESGVSLHFDWVVRAAGLCESQNPAVASLACRFVARALGTGGEEATVGYLARALGQGLEDHRAGVAGVAVEVSLRILGVVPDEVRRILEERLERLRADTRSAIVLAFRRGGDEALAVSVDGGMTSAETES